MANVALPLSLFGVLAVLLTALAAGGFLPALDAPLGLVSVVLIASFALPFGIFGAACVVLGVYMLFNALLVRIDAETIVTKRILFGIVLRRCRLMRGDIASVRAEIASMEQSLFSANAIYRLVARDSRTGKRCVLAESLEGEASMKDMEALLNAAA
jgi:hypothetical protein